MWSVWLIAGLQPHLAWVRLIRLRINQLSHTHTHTRERAAVMTARYTCSACTILPSPTNRIFYNIYLCLVSDGPSKATYVACGSKPLLHWRQCSSGLKRKVHAPKSYPETWIKITLKWLCVNFKSKKQLITWFHPVQYSRSLSDSPIKTSNWSSRRKCPGMWRMPFTQ